MLEEQGIKASLDKISNKGLPCSSQHSETVSTGTAATSLGFAY